jgi:serine/threonine-protein phosphatase 2A regulatory subunit B
VASLSPSLSNGNALKLGPFALLRMPKVVVHNSVSFMDLNVHKDISHLFLFMVCYICPIYTLKQVTSQETSLAASCRRIYAHAHDYHINSISNNRSCTSITYMH